MNLRQHLKEQRSLYQSILLHVFLLSLFFYGIQSQVTYKIPGKIDVIASYIQTEAITQPITKQHKKKILHQKHVVIKIPKHTSQIRKVHQVVHKVAQQRQEKGFAGQKENSLVTLLYRAINQHKQYPEIAQQMGRSGTVKLRFKLYPDGHISHLLVLHSSGSSLLDSSALTAVRDTMPLASVHPYLKQPQQIVLNITFQTTV